MKKTLSLLLALCLLCASALPAVAEELVSGNVEAPVSEAWTAGNGNGLWVEGEALPGDDLTAWQEGDFAVSAAEAGDDVIVLGPDEALEEGEVELGLPQGDDTSVPAEVNPGAERFYPGVGSSFSAAVCDDRSADALFAAYTRPIFYPNRRTPPLATTNAGRELKGLERAIYNRLKQAIIDIAAGNRASTTVQIPIADLLGRTAFTFADLGVDAVYDEYGWPTDESFDRMSDAFFNLLNFDLGLISEALWLDCSYELYWFNRYSSGISCSGPGCQAKYDETLDDYVLVSLDDNYTFQLPVLSQYAGSEPYTVNTGVIAGAKQAAANAKAIVNRYANCSDYAKLYGYAYEICSLVDYNDPAASKGWDMAEENPWKLIWVFDGDPATKVVCEGYAMAFQYLCELSAFDTGVRCFLVSGDAYADGDGGAHAWNVVRMDDGRNYLVDVTWMDGWDARATGGMADWIAGSQAGALFLAGGTGSATGGYDTDMDYGVTHRIYDQATRNAYPASVLTLAPGCYVPQGFMRIGGYTYYFDDGEYVTGVRNIDGVTYDFGSNGALTATWTPGWHTIGGKRYYFDENGLHTEHTVEVIPAVPPTCEADGLTEGKRCSVCGAVLVEQDVEPALGHVWGRPGYTLSEDGKTMTASRPCLRDAAHADAETVATTAAVAVEPTCTKMGSTTYTASFTKAVFKKQTLTRQDIPTLDHSPVTDAAVAPTYTSTGLTEGSHCGLCGAVLVAQQSVPALPRTSLNGAKVSVRAQLYTGKALKPAVTVKLNGQALKQGADYTVSYKNNKAVGKATAIVTGVEKYSGTVKTTFKISPKKVAGLKLVAGKKQLTASWKKASGITGYEIQYATKKSFAGAKKVRIKKATTAKATISKLKSGTTYYVRVRSYKVVKKAYYYSAWSVMKSMKAK